VSATVAGGSEAMIDGFTYDTDAVAVTFVTPSAELGGAEEYLRTLLEHLGADWVRGVVSLADGPARDLLVVPGRPFDLIPTSARLGILPAARRLRRVLLRERPDVVHANGVKAALVAVLAVRGLDLPVVWVKHDFSWDGPLAHFVAARCRLVVGVSGAVTETFKTGLAAVRVVHNGLPERDVDAYDGRRRLLELIGADDDVEAIVQVARLEPGKGQLELVEQLPELLARRPRAHVVLIGGPSRFDPGFARMLQDRVHTLGLERAVSMVGHRADAVELMAGADAVAVPTLPYTKPGTGEGFGLVAAEAMAVGTPVVAYAVGGLPEVIGDAGLLVPPFDRAALRDALARVLGEPGVAEQLRERGYERAARFALPAMAAAMRDIYREAAGRLPAVADGGPAIAELPFPDRLR
jgi:glycosyltransferase involved in cell wall biosynthesis